MPLHTRLLKPLVAVLAEDRLAVLTVLHLVVVAGLMGMHTQLFYPFRFFFPTDPTVQVLVVVKQGQLYRPLHLGA